MLPKMRDDGTMTFRSCKTRILLALAGKSKGEEVKKINTEIERRRKSGRDRHVPLPPFDKEKVIGAMNPSKSRRQPTGRPWFVLRAEHLENTSTAVRSSKRKKAEQRERDQ